MNTTLTDALDEAIGRATAKCHTFDLGSPHWERLIGALEVASYMRGYLNGVVDIDPVIRQAVATALDLVTA